MANKLQPLYPYLKRYRWPMAFGGVSVLLANGAWVVFPLVIEHAMNDLKLGATHRQIFLYAVALVALACFKGVFLFLTRWILIGVSRDIEFDLRNDLFLTLEKQPPEYYQRNRTGDIMARMTNDLNAVRMLLGPAIMYSANTIVFTARRPLLHVAHQPPSHPLRVPAPAPRQRAHPDLRTKNPSALRTHPGNVLRNLRPRAGEFLRRPPRPRLRPGGSSGPAFELDNLEYIRRSLPLARLVSMLWPMLEFTSDSPSSSPSSSAAARSSMSASPSADSRRLPRLPRCSSPCP